MTNQEAFMTKLNVHTSARMPIIFQEEHEAEMTACIKKKEKCKKSKLEAFFDLCATDLNASNLLYEKIVCSYVWEAKEQEWNMSKTTRCCVKALYRFAKKHGTICNHIIFANSKKTKKFDGVFFNNYYNKKCKQLLRYTSQHIL